LLGLPEEKIRVVPNGVDLSCFNGKTDASVMREELGIGSEPLVLTVSRLIKRKNPELLVSAFAKLLKTVPDAKLVIAGAGREKDNLYRQIEGLGIADSVFMMGGLPREKVAQLMAAATVFVLSSRMESFGLSLLEASAAGLPVVCSNAGGVPEVFQDGFNALLYRPGDSDAMARAMISLVQDKDLAKKVSANALQTASGFTWSKAAEGTLGVYEEVVRENRRDQVASRSREEVSRPVSER
jgi:glycogen(starch) synthase